MLEDFKRALARVQGDFGFYVGCQTNPAATLAGYDLTDDERAALSDPKKLDGVLRAGIGVDRLRPITVKIKGTHDWINRAMTGEAATAERERRIAANVAAVRQASTEEDRRRATLRLMEAIG